MKNKHRHDYEINKPNIAVDTSSVSEKNDEKPKTHPLFAYRFVALIFGLIAALLMFLPIVTLNDGPVSVNINVFQLLAGSELSVPTPIIFVAFILPLLSGTMYTFSKNVKWLNIPALVLSVVAAAALFLSEDIFIFLQGERIYSSVDLRVGGVFAGFFAVATALYPMRELIGNNRLTIRDITEIALLVGLALLFDQYVKVDFTGGLAGSINLAMLPLFILAFRLGFFKGFIAGGVVFGLIACLIDGWGFASYPFDYLLAYGLIGLVGLFRHMAFKREGKTTAMNIVWFVLAMILGTVGRYIGSSLSSMIIYQAELGFALSYNWYILASGAIAMMVMLALYKPLIIINQQFPTSEDRLASR